MLRRSSRARTTPLEFWNFETAEVTRLETGEVTIIRHKSDVPPCPLRKSNTTKPSHNSKTIDSTKTTKPSHESNTTNITRTTKLSRNTNNSNTTTKTTKPSVTNTTSTSDTNSTTNTNTTSILPGTGAMSKRKAENYDSPAIHPSQGNSLVSDGVIDITFDFYEFSLQSSVLVMLAVMVAMLYGFVCPSKPQPIHFPSSTIPPIFCFLSCVLSPLSVSHSIVIHGHSCLTLSSLFSSIG